ncbi:DsrE/DsrF/DrsH-like family protein [bacterium]|nr:DsrE/DsrF/DrsH-like family protein [bacterium]
MGKVAIVVNDDSPSKVFPAFIIGSSAAATGDEVIMFYTPGGGSALVKGKLEAMEGKGLPDMMELVEGYQLLGGRLLLCELCFEAKDIAHDSIRDGVEIVGATTFVAEATGATLSLVFG